MTGNTDHYAALGITPQANAAEVARAYRMMMRARHPDTRTTSGSDSAVTGTASDVQGIMDAYAVLKDPVRRAAYDRHQGVQPEHTQPKRVGNDGIGFSAADPPLTVGPVRWHPVPDRTQAPVPGPISQGPQGSKADGIRPRRSPFLALILPTQTSTARPGSEHGARKAP